MDFMFYILSNRSSNWNLFSATVALTQETIFTFRLTAS